MSTKTINGIELYYEIHGQGEPLILIHGLGSCTEDWQYQITYFAKNYQVIVVDIRGHGQTDKPSGAYSIELFADDVVQLLNTLKITKVNVIGLSMGGMIAFELAVRHPQLIKSSVIVNSGPGYINMDIKTRLKFRLRLLMLRVMSMEKVGAKIAEGLFPGKQGRYLRALFVESFCKNDKPSYIKSLKALAHWNVVEELDKLVCPSLILAADNDYTSIESKQKYVELMKNAQLQIIPNSHHALPVEKPDEFNQVVAQFLGSLNN